MTAFAFLMTFLVGAFTGAWALVYVSCILEKKEKRALAMMQHPSSQTEMPFNVLDYTKSN